MRRTNLLLAIFSALLMGRSTAFAGGFRLIDQDAAGTAKGNALVATADSPSAAYYNPAGLTQLSGTQYELGYYGVFYNADYSGERSNSSNKDKFQGPPQFYVSKRISDSQLGAGFALYSPYGLGIEWPEDSGFRTLIREAQLVYLTASPVLAWQLTSTISVAAGFNFNYADLTLDQGLTPDGDDHFRFEGNGFGTGYTAGLLWKPSEEHAFGLRYVSDSYVDMEGETKLTGTPDAEDAQLNFPFPEFATVGYSYRPTPNWNIEFDLDWTNWERVDTVNIQNTQIGSAPNQLQYRASFAYLLGATYQLPQQYSISFGYMYNENSIPSKNFTPAVPDVNKNSLSLGIGKKYEDWAWNIAYQYAFSNTRHVRGSAASLAGETADGDYKVDTQAITVSIHI